MLFLDFLCCKFAMNNSNFNKQARLGILAVLLVANFFVWSKLLAEERGRELEVAFLDVGQGDAIFIEAPNGNQILIDGGPGKSVLAELSKVMPVYDRSIDAILVSNPDKDHIGGLLEVLKTFEVGAVLEPGTKPDTAIYQEFEKAVADEGATKILARRGMKIVMDEETGTVLSILFPDRNVAETKTNDGSIVAKLTYGNTAVILTGDAPEGIERYLVLLDGANLQSDLLKVGHHGSRTSTSAEFLAAVAPAAAVISVGENNSYGHPNQETLARLKAAGAEIFRTDQNGTIIFVSDGRSFQRKWNAE